MAMSIFTNASSMSAINSLNRANAAQTISAMRMTSGKRINSASDDAAGMQIASRLNSQVRGMNVAMRNISDTKSMLKTAEGAFVESDNILNRMKDLATQAANDTNAKGDRDALQKEFTQLGQELKSILDNTSYSGEKLFATGGKLTGKLNFQTGAQKGEGLELDVAKQIEGLIDNVTKEVQADGTAKVGTIEKDLDVAQKVLGTKTTDEDAARQTYEDEAAKTIVTTGPTNGQTTQAQIDAAKSAWDTAITATKAANDALDAVFERDDYDAGVANLTIGNAKTAMKAVTELEKAVATYGEMRSTLGANINRLDSSAANLSNMKDNTELAMSSIVDTDFAVEMTNSSRNQMLMQTSSMMLKQSNGMVNMIGSLLG
ncbi:lateral flagellin [Yersinia frederiksenii]|uniref:flagellin N-terminal helical domain-containing protein n=2 Tax=Yersinia frederiksenii TaxID=29484 RepID=UPI0005E37517|nr:flagellin [Yersinia frederiksenii]CFQ97848.1 lateral flagellin [Yersinia frederiksenii]